MKSLSAKFGSSWRWVIQPVLVFGVLVIGFFGAKGLSSRDTTPSRVEDRTYAPIVEVKTVETGETQIQIETTAALQAQTKVDLVAQVSGKVTSVHPAFRAGGTFQVDEVLLQMERTDYELAVAGANAEVFAAKTAMQTLEAEAQAAREEWRLLKGDLEVPTLVGKVPQLEEAQARILAAEANLDSAKLALSRTSLRLPWSGRIVSTQVDVGGVVQVGQPLGSAYSTEVFEFAVPLRQDQLRWAQLPGDMNIDPDSPPPITTTLVWPGASLQELESDGLHWIEMAIRAVEGIRKLEKNAAAGVATVTIHPTGEFDTEYMQARVFEALESIDAFPPVGAKAPQVSAGLPPSPATVQIDLAGTKVSAPGRVTRIESELDARSRFARLIVEVDLSDLEPSVAARCLPGLFGEVRIDGQSVRAVTAIPRSALRDHNQVWIAEDSVLRFRQVETIYASQGILWVRGLPDQTHLVVSDLEVVTDGMQIRVQRDLPEVSNANGNGTSTGFEGQQ